MRVPVFVLFGLLPLAPAAAQAQIVHEPIGCMMAGRYPLIEAVIEPASVVARARVHFKSTPSAAYHFVEMIFQDGKFVGKLPKPALEASPVTYLIRAMTTDARHSETQAIDARVVASATECPEGSLVAPVGGPGAVTVLAQRLACLLGCRFTVHVRTAILPGAGISNWESRRRLR